MADNKQYITQTQENGAVMISEDVIATIASHAANEVEGVVGLSVKPGADIAELIGKKNWGKGVKIIIDESGKLFIECNIIISYGQSVVTVAKNVQDAVTNAVESLIGVEIETINVNVCGIDRQ